MIRRRTKIVATYGPAVAEPATLVRLLEAGVDVVRLNFSHGDHAGHEKAIRSIRRTAEEIGRHVAILQDLRGPKIRVGTLAEEPIHLREGEELDLLPVGGGRSSLGSDGSPIGIPVEGHPGLAEDLSTDDRVLLSDGAICLRVVDVHKDRVRCRIEVGGNLSSRKGINFPDTPLKTIETITEKDKSDLAFGIEQGVDLVALSFVRTAGDVDSLRKLIGAAGADVPIIAKVEKREALEDLDAIVASSDGLMVARGDLGVETDLAEVALRQKEIIRACNRQGKTVITATQMLESMITHASPTRAEVSDISNAIFDGTDAVMLSGETAIGSYPVEAATLMSRVAEKTDIALGLDRGIADRPYLDEIPDAVAHAACVMARRIGAAALICFTQAGLTARLVARYRPSSPIVALSPNPETVRRIAIVWGIVPLATKTRGTEDQLLESALRETKKAGLIHEGEPVVVAAGLGSGDLMGQTNLIRVEIV
jgi:pyruvate kinase